MSFPDLSLSQWRDTRDTIQAYAKIIGKVRRALAPARKHWWHITLRCSAVGFHTPPIPYENRTFEMHLNFATHELQVRTSDRSEDFISLVGQSPHEFGTELLEILDTMDINIVEIDPAVYADDTPSIYHDTAVGDYWRATSQIDAIFKQFQAGLRGETGPIVLWPHHFDLAMLWFSGRLVPEQDPADPEYADEQMNFGFVTGDEMIADPYFYITAYPQPDGFIGSRLPEGGYWQTDSFKGAILPYQALTQAENPRQLLLNFLQAGHKAGAVYMVD